jgi:glycosyltransferase involved in cell wall biosynthesis
MKISWIVPGFQSDPNDRCIPALTDLAHRVAQEHELQVFALQYPGREDCYRIGRVQIRSFAAGRLPRLGRVMPLARAIKAVASQPADLLHAFWAAEPALVGATAAKLSGRKLIAACMGGEPVYLSEINYGAANKALDRLYLQLAVRGANVLTAGSQVQADLLKAKFGKQVCPVVMPLGVDLSRFTAPKVGKQALPANPLVLAVGSLLPVKGHANLIKAVSRLPHLRLRIVGEGPGRATLQNLISELKLVGRVELAGAVPAESMPDEYQRADLLALSSYYESQCVALLEGLACGLPVVAAPVGIAPELLADSQAGELAQDNSPEALAAAITRLLARREEWAELQAEAVAAAAKVSLEVCAQRLSKLYSSLTD